ncbi:3-phenylpropionate-dihydrodiol/cinnamic acid-dihydrodiol dehydrogenase [Microbulbifer aestuariivivens]|uniref:3-phenylpropionate-dihydrodiol/cinnamic acid-dihydrodiol dehydrogenase n=1 Tax=Microbulbifer aestuariivivens TaxID=1908308 RepID=A0ABP9WMR3_9GAMM
MTAWKHAMITGGGSGIGYGLTLRMLKRGTQVSILDLNLPEEKKAALDSAAKAGGGRWEYFPMDICTVQEVDQAVAKAVRAFGSPDLALNCAGILINRPFVDLTPEEFHRVVNVNLNGSFHFARAAVPHLQPGSRLALIASLAGLTSNYGYAGYSASKFGVVGLATNLRFELEPLGINVSCICPGEIRTPMVAQEKVDAHPASLELRKAAGSLDVDTACDQIFSGLQRGKWQIIPGVRAKAVAMAYRLIPGIVFSLSGIWLKKILSKESSVTSS